MKIDSPNIISQLGVSGSAEISGSLNVLGSVTAESFPGLLSSSAQVSYPGLSNIPAGIVSGSDQVKDLLPAGTISGSGQVSYSGLSNIPAGIISSSAQVQLNQLSGTTFSSSNFTFPQELIVQGKLTAQEFHTELVSSSIIYESGSTKFGDSLDDTHSFTGSVVVLGGITGSLKATNGIVSGSTQVQLEQISGTTFASSDFSFPQDVTISGSVGIQRVEEKTTVSATAATGTVNFDFLTQSILYYTANASGNWTLNIRGDGSTTFDSVVQPGRQ